MIFYYGSYVGFEFGDDVLQFLFFCVIEWLQWCLYIICMQVNYFVVMFDGLYEFVVFQEIYQWQQCSYDVVVFVEVFFNYVGFVQCNVFVWDEV